MSEHATMLRAALRDRGFPALAAVVEEETYASVPDRDIRTSTSASNHERVRSAQRGRFALSAGVLRKARIAKIPTAVAVAANSRSPIM